MPLFYGTGDSQYMCVQMGPCMFPRSQALFPNTHASQDQHNDKNKLK